MTGTKASPEPSILVIDDDELVRTLIGRVAREYSHAVTLAGGGQEVLTALEARAFDLVITDLRMPLVDGFAVLRRLRKQRPDTRIIAVTGYAGNEIEGAMGLLGADLLYKPFGAQELRRAIERALGAPGRTW